MRNISRGIIMILAGLSFMALHFSNQDPLQPPASVDELEPAITAIWPAPLLEISSAPLPAQPRPSAPATPEGREATADISPAPPGDPAATPLVAASSGAGPLAGWPVEGQITHKFGCSPYYTGLAGPDCPAEAPWFHDGLDIGASLGRPVRAALTGTVIFAGPDGSGPVCRGGYRGYGLGVVVDNGAGWQAMYAHLSRLEVAEGQAVRPETIVGAVGETGCVSGPHLHFGLRHNGDLVDPAALRGK